MSCSGYDEPAMMLPFPMRGGVDPMFSVVDESDNESFHLLLQEELASRFENAQAVIAEQPDYDERAFTSTPAVPGYSLDCPPAGFPTAMAPLEATAIIAATLPAKAADAPRRRSGRWRPVRGAAKATASRAGTARARVAAGRPAGRRRTAGGVVECDLACDECGYVARTTDGLRRHRLGHRPPTKVCPLCPRQFVARQNLTRHITTVHRMHRDLLSEAPEKTECDFVGCAFQNHRYDKVKEHMLRLHPHGKLLRCGLNRFKRAQKPCEYVCYEESTMLQHQALKHLPPDE